MRKTPDFEDKYKIYTTMSKICQITGKKAMGGCNVSHSKRHTKRTFDVNLFRRKFYWVEQDVWIELNVSAAGLRTINKNRRLRKAISIKRKELNNGKESKRSTRSSYP